MLFLSGIRKKNKDTLFLFDPAQIKKISILNKRSNTVGIRWHDIIGIEYGNGIGFERCGKILPVLNKKAAVYG